MAAFQLPAAAIPHVTQAIKTNTANAKLVIGITKTDFWAPILTYFQNTWRVVEQALPNSASPATRGHNRLRNYKSQFITFAARRIRRFAVSLGLGVKRDCRKGKRGRFLFRKSRDEILDLVVVPALI